MIQERERWVDCIHLDLKKAFDEAPHNTFILKLEHAGSIKGKLLEQMGDYLAGREKRTTIKNINSNWCNISSGVSVWGPTMLIIFDKRDC